MADTFDLYYRDKATFEEMFFGSVDTSAGINFAFSIDKTYGSTKIIILNDKDFALEKNTVCRISFNNTHWVVKQDTKSVVFGEKILFKHEIDLLSPEALLKNRDLLSCGFNKNRYTYQTFFERLISLSNFTECQVDLSGVFVANRQVKTIKVFENYTLGKAIEEFCNGENAVHRLNFDANGVPTLSFISKSGLNKATVDLDNATKHKVVAYSHEEMSNKDFASRVISNVENCVSSIPQRYPMSGGKFLDSDDFNITPENGYFKLPHKAIKVNKLFIHPRIRVDFGDLEGHEGFLTIVYPVAQFNCLVQSVEQLVNILSGLPIPSAYFSGEIKTIRQLAQAIYNMSVVELNIDKQENKLTSAGNPSLHPFFINGNTASQYENQQWFFQFKDGDDKITNFLACDKGGTNKGTYINRPTSGPFSDYTLLNGSLQQILRPVDRGVYLYGKNSNGQNAICIYTYDILNADIWANTTKFACEYIPQSNIRLEYDNETVSDDIELFNQTGSFVDSYAVSKLIKSHAKDVGGNTYNYYIVYNNYADILEVGQRVYKVINGKKELCIIDNVSIDYYKGDKFYVMYSISRQVAVKSSLVSADSNVRDYDTPQKNNVVRKKNYRDYFEFTTQVSEYHRETFYHSNLESIFNLGQKSQGANLEYQAFILLEDNRCYQISTYVVNYECSATCVVDFHDNNIIGYDKMNTGSVWTWSISDWDGIFTRTNRYNIPIDYTKDSGDYGEITKIKVKMSTLQQISTAFNIYKSGVDSSVSMIDSAPLCDVAFYQQVGGEVELVENTYNKDGLEIPFFQYTAQIGDSGNITIGSNILEKKLCANNEVFVYQFHLRGNNVLSESAFTNVSLEYTDYMENGENFIKLENACIFTLVNANPLHFEIEFFDYLIIHIPTGYVVEAELYTGTIEGKSFEIVSATAYNFSASLPISYANKLILAIRDCDKELDANSQLTLYISNYKI